MDERETRSPVAPDDTGVTIPAPGATVVDLVEHQARGTPQARAVDDGIETWTYHQLWQRASAIAARLQETGVGHGHAVGVCLPRTNSAVAAILGVLLAGSAYVPLEPGYPAHRLRRMCDRVAMPVVLGPPALTAALPDEVVTLDVDALDPAPRAVTGPRPDPGDPAYILFTSGSTGDPKGVLVTHANVMALMAWVRGAFGPSELGLVAATTSFSFDPSVIELFAPLTTGGALRLLADARDLVDLEPEVSMLVSPPSVVSELVRARRLPSTLETVLLGGEVVPPALATDLLARGGVRRVVNSYGPTEATVMVTAHEVELPIDGTIAIGREVGLNRISLLDELDRPVPDGQIGQLWISGPQVALGYVGEPDLTGASFATMVDSDGARRRRYRTGDLARRRPDGTLEFRGRADQQLKVRGFRIEPAEVEAALEAQPGVARAAVTATGDGPAAHLVAHYITNVHDGLTVIPEPAALRAALAARLPPYLVPSRYLEVAALPLTGTGKLDRRALGDGAPATRSGSAWSAPLGVTATTADDRMEPVPVVVARLAAEVLGCRGPVRPDDDLLDDLGATSLAMIRLLTRLEETFACRLPVGRIMADTTIAGVAALVAGRAAAEDDLLRVNPQGSRTPLFLIHAYLGSVLRYRRLGPALSPDQPVVGIHVHDLEGDTTTRVTIEDLATRAVDRIRSVRPDGPYLLGGHSAGGLVAYEAARRLAGQGHQVAQVVLIDTPARTSRASYYWAEVVVNWPTRDALRPRPALRAVRAMVSSRTSLRRAPGPSGSGLPRGAADPDGDRIDLAVERAGRLSNLAVRDHLTFPYDGDVVVLHTDQGRLMAGGDRALGWRRFVSGQVRSLPIPGGHNTLFDPPHLATVAATVADLLDEQAVSRRIGPAPTVGPVRPLTPLPQLGG